MRLVRHISFSNVIAMLALFIALGGAAYAGTKISGSSIKNGSIGGGKLKSETITGDKIKKGTLTGAQIANQSITGAQIQNGSIDASQINVSTLGAVPLAQAAQTASKADSATTATSATNADNAKHAETADSATKADTATSADTATTAAEALKVGGKSAAELKTELELTCGAGTEFFGGMCWDETTRPAKLWLGAVVECAKEGGRLPSIEELIAFVLQEGPQVTGQSWSADIDQLEGVGNKEVVFTTDENGRSTADGSPGGGILGFRCVFPQSN
ncbi:MAG: hypothetical protein JST53_17965 [Actinobacteria bacterium]|nr:hypothetical protein [Actinomycetota bacterium]